MEKSIDIYIVKLKKIESIIIEDTDISSPEIAYDAIRKLKIDDLAQEMFGFLSLNVKHKVIGVHIVSFGTLNAALIHPREVFKAAILNNAASIICFHNHPSGDSTPSKPDVEITERLANCGELLGIAVLDHLIIGGNQYVSLKEKGLF